MKQRNLEIPKIIQKKREGSFVDYMNEDLSNMDPEFLTMTAQDFINLQDESWNIQGEVFYTYVGADRYEDVI